FLEAEGLIQPERTPSGYRKFYEQDVERLKSILRMQRDEYLPLKVIKERLLHQEAGDGEAATAAPPTPETDQDLAEPPTGLQMSIEEMASATGIDRDRIRELESFGLVCSHGPESAKYYDGDDYVVLSIVKDFFRHGVEPRHLTMYRHFAEREASFFESIIMPQCRSPSSRAPPASSSRRFCGTISASTSRPRKIAPCGGNGRIGDAGSSPGSRFSRSGSPRSRSRPPRRSRPRPSHPHRPPFPFPEGGRLPRPFPRGSPRRRPRRGRRSWRLEPRCSRISTRARSCSRRTRMRAVRSRASRRS